ncbi:MAG TPA: hypothetical protein PKX87_07675 [Alphaproteobacteria bacterium]|nr:hypothetical protein [Alphaproteobacteria bacterium]
MEKPRLISYTLIVCRWYLIVFHLLFGIWFALVFASLMDDPAIRNYCIYAEDNEPYDFIWGEDTRCRVDWSFFYGQVLPALSMLYGVLFGPVWLTKFLLGRIKPGPPR